MAEKLTFFRCSIPLLTVNVYAASEREAIDELQKRIERAAHILSDPSFDETHPGTGFVRVGYDSTAIEAQKDVRAKLYIAATVDGKTLPPFFVRYDPLSGKPIADNDPE